MKQKKQNRLRITAFVIVIFLLICQAVPVFAIDVPKATNDFYVNDFAGILSEETKDQIMKVNLELHEKTGAQVVVVTMNTLEGESLEIFATDLFRSYGIGDKEKNNGVLLLLVKDDREIKIEVGYGLEGAINDAKAGRILDTHVVPQLKEDKWDEGTLSGFNAIVWEIEEEYSTDIESNAPNPDKESESTSLVWSLAAAGLSVILGIIVTKCFLYKSKKLVNLLLWGWVITEVLIMGALFGVWIALFTLLIGGVATLFGYCAVSPGSGYSSSSQSGNYRSSSGSRSSSSSGSRYSGGGGRSGGGGASRKF